MNAKMKTTGDAETAAVRMFNVGESRALLAALRALDGRQVVEAGVPILQPYAFKGGLIHYAIAFNIATLNRIEESYGKSHNALVLQHFGTKPAAEQPEKMAEFQKQALELVAADGVKITDLRMIDFGDLNIDETRVPGSVIATLLPILINTPGEAAPPAK